MHKRPPGCSRGPYSVSLRVQKYFRAVAQAAAQAGFAALDGAGHGGFIHAQPLSDFAHIHALCTAVANMKDGEATATAWGCDLTYDYVKINADYRS